MRYERLIVIETCCTVRTVVKDVILDNMAD